MKLKRAVLAELSRDELKEIVDQLEMDGVDRRSAEAMREALRRSRRRCCSIAWARARSKRSAKPSASMRAAGGGNSSNGCSPRAPAGCSSLANLLGPPWRTLHEERDKWQAAQFTSK